MIYTVTANPALDVTIEREEPLLGKEGTVRPRQQQRHAGGKGIDVSRVIRNLGGTSVAMGFLGGFTGHDIEGHLLRDDGLELDFVYISQETRTNVIIIAPDENNPNRRLTYRHNLSGPEVQPMEFLELINKIRNLARGPAERRPTHAAICGSLSGQEMQALGYVSIIQEFK